MISPEALSNSNLVSRHESLKLLGLRQWYGRYQLPGAAKTPDTLFLEIGAAIESGQVDVSHDASLKAKAELALIVPGIEKPNLDQVEELLVSAASVIEDESTVSLALESAKRSVSQAFESSLSMMTANQAIILYESQNRANEESESTFLQSFLKFSVSSLLTVSDIKFLEWPVFSSKALQAEQSGYFESVFNRWALDADWSGLKYVFYFGYHFEELEQQLLAIKIAKESECVFVPISITITELLGAPIKKRSLWESISRLRCND